MSGFPDPSTRPNLSRISIKADFGYMILFGLMASIPAMILGGPLWGSFIAKHVNVPLPEHAQDDGSAREGNGIPSFKLAISLIALPLLMIGLKQLQHVSLSHSLIFTTG